MGVLSLKVYTILPSFKNDAFGQLPRSVGGIGEGSRTDQLKWMALTFHQYQLCASDSKD